MTRKKKTAILFLILLGVALLPLLFLKAWAAYRLERCECTANGPGDVDIARGKKPF
jgi:hypothetical protein